MKLLLITKAHVAVYEGRKQVALYEVDWSLEHNPRALVNELLSGSF